VQASSNIFGTWIPGEQVPPPFPLPLHGPAEGPVSFSAFCDEAEEGRVHRLWGMLWRMLGGMLWAPPIPSGLRAMVGCCTTRTLITKAGAWHQWTLFATTDTIESRRIHGRNVDCCVIYTGTNILYGIS